jgi:hypothetical protein
MHVDPSAIVGSVLPKKPAWCTTRFAANRLDEPSKQSKVEKEDDSVVEDWYPVGYAYRSLSDLPSKFLTARNKIVP